MPTTQTPGNWRVAKSYGHEEGLSCTFRQWQASHSHCRFLHGYALSFRFVFTAAHLDGRGWCIDFGGLKPLRAWLHDMFDHTLLVAEDDPERDALLALGHAGLAQTRLVPMVGCEAFAQLAHAWAERFLDEQTSGRVVCAHVDVGEHPGNSARFTPSMDAPAG